MKRVIQENPSGCGLACVAMLAGKSYKEVREKARLIPGFDNDRYLRTTSSDLRLLLEEYGITASKRLIPFRDWDSMPSLCILAIKYNAAKKIWHWVVFACNDGTKYVLDPSPHIKTSRRTDFRRIKPKWYLRTELHKDR